jgi:hypothetical protein
MKTIVLLKIAFPLFLLSASPAFSQSSITSSSSNDHLIGQYTAYIGEQDLYSSRGQRLTQPWQIIRQDRANFHHFLRRDGGDTADMFFDSVENRASMEAMLARGNISVRAAREIVGGHVWVHVEIYGQGGVGRSVHISVSQ